MIYLLLAAMVFPALLGAATPTMSPCPTPTPEEVLGRSSQSSMGF
jgi:hypothetical protein